MNRPLAMLLFLIFWVDPAAADSIVVEAGQSFPGGSFANPASTLSVQKGAESDLMFGVQYVRPLVIVDFLVSLSYVQFDEQYEGPPEAGEPQDYKHTFIPATVGLRKRFLPGSPVQPFLGGAVGLYGYMATGKVLIEEPAGSGEFRADDFTAVIRPGIQFGLGAVIDVPFTFDVALELKYHVMIFQGVGDDLTDREFPYTIDDDTRTFTTLAVGLVF